MRIRCEQCSVLYDDEFRWTICPHFCLEASPEGVGYCEVHDLFHTDCGTQKAREAGLPVTQHGRS